jgi:RNA polymerase II subunit A C-terminal domain phosphatase
MQIRAPHSLHYPITVSALLRRPGDTVERFAALFSYTYRSTVTEENKYGEEQKVEKTFPAEFQSETEGKLVAWKIRAGEVIEKAEYVSSYRVVGPD